MSDAQKLHEDLSAGQRAADALETMGSALDALEAQYFDAFKASDFRDEKGREKLFIATQIIGRVRKHLKQQVTDGNLAKRELEELKTFGERRKILGVV